jgi:hypothetical protein
MSTNMKPTEAGTKMTLISWTPQLGCSMARLLADEAFDGFR